jgi:hypothetical protein
MAGPSISQALVQRASTDRASRGRYWIRASGTGLTASASGLAPPSIIDTHDIRAFRSRPVLRSCEIAYSAAGGDAIDHAER